MTDQTTTLHVYVDSLSVSHSTNPYVERIGRTHGFKWCHLFASPDDEAALHAIAAEIGVKRAWFQQKSRVSRYMLTPPQRAAAVALGAVEADLEQWLNEHSLAR